MIYRGPTVARKPDTPDRFAWLRFITLQYIVLSANAVGNVRGPSLCTTIPWTEVARSFALHHHLIDTASERWQGASGSLGLLQVLGAIDTGWGLGEALLGFRSVI